jgi:UDP-N-acetylglucosamine--N-acetylmuramyl-(pentapeptide) pyrophosphoryl-undecaprenol N-acetylglucosamine transferase
MAAAARALGEPAADEALADLVDEAAEGRKGL